MATSVWSTLDAPCPTPASISFAVAMAIRLVTADSLRVGNGGVPHGTRVEGVHGQNCREQATVHPHQRPEARMRRLRSASTWKSESDFLSVIHLAHSFVCEHLCFPPARTTSSGRCLFLSGPLPKFQGDGGQTASYDRNDLLAPLLEVLHLVHCCNTVSNSLPCIPGKIPMVKTS